MLRQYGSFRTFFFASLWLSLGVSLGVAGCGTEQSASTEPAPDATAAAAAQSRPVPLLLISLDGFRHDYLQLADTPNLNRLVAGGVTSDGMVHAFPTKTFVTHWTLVTGLFAGNHGVMANSMWDPERDETFGLGNREAVIDAAWYDGEPIWNTAERQGLTAATFFWPGSEAPVNGMRPSYWMPYDGSVPHAERIDQVLAWLDLPDAERPDFLSLYFSEVDSVGHRHGPNAAETAAAVAAIDADFGRLLDGLEARGLLGAMHILVVADHGMAEIAPERWIWLEDYLPLDPSLEKVRVSDRGPAAQIWATGMDEDAIVAALADAHPRMRVWEGEHTPEHYGFAGHARTPDVLAEADHGWMIGTERARADMDWEPPRGMHGWDPFHREMHGIFIGHGPAFSGVDDMPPVRSVDLYSLMAHLLDIDPAINDGSLDAFRAVLRAPGAGPDEPAVLLPVLYGARYPDASSAEPLDGLSLSSAVSPLVLRGELEQDCAGADCSFVLRSGERSLMLDVSPIVGQLDALAVGPALVGGVLLPGEPMRLRADRILVNAPL